MKTISKGLLSLEALTENPGSYPIGLVYATQHSSLSMIYKCLPLKHSFIFFKTYSVIQLIFRRTCLVLATGFRAGNMMTTPDKIPVLLNLTLKRRERANMQICKTKPNDDYNRLLWLSRRLAI